MLITVSSSPQKLVICYEHLAAPPGAWGRLLAARRCLGATLALLPPASGVENLWFGTPLAARANLKKTKTLSKPFLNNEINNPPPAKGVSAVSAIKDFWFNFWGIYKILMLKIEQDR